jgi:putative transposase
MSRPLRIELAGGLYHVTSRGDRREDIYSSDADRLQWLAILAEVCEQFNWRCHAWCQMTNHYHLVVETPEANLAQGMRQLNGVYTQYVNRTHRRIGHVFQGRYKAILVERDAYLVELSRYVVLNPVRAGMVSLPGEWPWSSWGAMMGQTPSPEWLETRWLLRQFSEDEVRARKVYEDCNWNHPFIRRFPASRITVIGQGAIIRRRSEERRDFARVTLRTDPEPRVSGLHKHI